MKRIALVLAVSSLLVASGGAFAQDNQPTAAKQAAVERYMRVVPLSQVLNDTYAGLAKQMPPGERDAFMTRMGRSIDIKALERITKAALLKHFTLEEINAMSDYQSSKYGASAMAKMGVYMADVMPAVTEEVQQAMQKMYSSGN